jgi:hypothetical protein
LQHASGAGVANRTLAFYLHALAVRGLHQLLGHPTVARYAVARLELSASRAKELVAAGKALEDLPLIDAAFCAGRLSWSRVRILVRPGHALLPLPRPCSRGPAADLRFGFTPAGP